MDAYSAFLSVLTVLGIWTAVSFVATPVVLLLFQAQARVDARCTQELRRTSWAAATQRA